ncbi:MAG: hypothetical protein WD426_08445 [Anditalea sp.]
MKGVNMNSVNLIFWMVLVGFFPTQLLAQTAENYPLYDKETVKNTQDWLIEEADIKTALYKTERGELVLSNGLISRIFSLDPDGSTIGIENLMTGENMLRSVRPEAMVEMNGMSLPVGGLKGQPIHNYLLESWIPELKGDPGALKLQSFITGPTEARFKWKKRPDWMPIDVPWPAPGKKISFTYSGDDKLINYLIEKTSSDQGRDKLFIDEFRTLDTHWKIQASSADERNSFINEGKPGEIMALSNQAVYAEVSNPGSAKVWMAQIDPGTDQGSSWGPGIALVGQDGEVYKLNTRPADNSFGIFDGTRERKAGKLEEGKPVFLRIEQKEAGLIFSYAYTSNEFKELANIPKASGPIVALRVGKMDSKGGSEDYSSAGESGRSHILNVEIMGSQSQKGKDELAKSLQYLKKIKVKVHYEMYDGIPLMSKWITIENNAKQDIIIHSFKSEILALMESESAVDGKTEWIKPNISVETDFRFGGMSTDNLYSSSIAWNEDPAYKTQVNYELQTPVLLEAYPKFGPMKTLPPTESMDSFRTWELFHDSWDRERKGLAEKRMYRSQAPWITENPIMMHVRNADDASVMKAIDQCAEVGFEMVIMTFGSGFQIENDSDENLDRMKQLADYAHSKGIALGGYSLLASRSIDAENDVVMPEGKTPRFGNSPCLQSEWGNAYFDKLYKFYQKTGQDILEHDGSYPGDVCASNDHPGHKGLEDSQWNQYEKIQTFYEWARGKGVFLNVPDHYFMAGSNKTGMGYRETNWSLPRAQQEIIERQNIYDGTWQKTPSMGWMFVPLVQYHGGGAAATIEPLKDHLPHYEQRLANLFGAGVQACYRGPQLYDSPQTKEIVKKWVDFYKNHREILDSDIVHIRRPDGRDFDGILHVNPFGEDKGLIMLYNPLDTPVKKTLPVNLYYAGLKENAMLTDGQGNEMVLQLQRDYTIELPINIPPRSQQWFLVR